MTANRQRTTSDKCFPSHTDIKTVTPSCNRRRMGRGPLTSRVALIEGVQCQHSPRQLVESALSRPHTTKRIAWYNSSLSGSNATFVCSLHPQHAMWICPIRRKLIDLELTRASDWSSSPFPPCLGNHLRFGRRPSAEGTTNATQWLEGDLQTT